MSYWIYYAILLKRAELAADIIKNSIKPSQVKQITFYLNFFKYAKTPETFIYEGFQAFLFTVHITVIYVTRSWGGENVALGHEKV